LTKRSNRMAKLLSTILKDFTSLKHIWWGVSVEDRKHGFGRIDELRDTPAALKFLSIEPLLEDLGKLNLSGIHWVIVGGESGPGARPIKREWVVSIRDQCGTYGGPFFFKQWGGVRRKRTGRLYDGRTYDEYLQRIPMPIPDRSRCLEFAEAFLANIKGIIEQSSLVQVTV